MSESNTTGKADLTGVDVLRSVGTDAVYDNLYAKPSPMGDTFPNSVGSVAVLFSVRGVWYEGQFSFTDCVWTTLPGDEKKRVFVDRVVGCWTHLPGTAAAFRKYKAAVESGMNRDRRSRLAEYDPETDHGFYPNDKNMDARDTFGEIKEPKKEGTPQ